MADTFKPGSNQSREYLENPTRYFSRGRPIRRLALVSPWAGGNLGNSTILSAVIFSLSERIPDVEFVGITLNPEQTRRRFGIESFPLSAACGLNHGRLKTSDSEVAQRQNLSSLRTIQWLKRVPLFGSLLRTMRAWTREIVHIAAAARIVRRLDGIIIPGGGALDEFWGGTWAHPWNLLKWSVLGRVYRVPFFFKSVGKCCLERPLSRFFVRIALRLASYRSYRDPDSKEAVQVLINAPNDPVFPDLAFSYPTPVTGASASIDKPDKWLVIGISPIAYCDPRVWPVKDEGLYRAYLYQLAEILKWMLKQGHQLLFFATDSPDLETIEDVLRVADISENSSAIRMLPGPVEQSINHHLEAIGRADLVVASRLHGVILSHLVAVPVLAISYDQKVDVQMAIARQKDYCLDINSLELGSFVNRFEALKAAREREAASLRSDAALFRQQLDSQYDRIFGIKLQRDNGRLAESERPILAGRSA